MPPTYSPAPTWKGGCDDPHNFFLDKCVRKRYKPKPSAVAWDALGTVGQVSVMLVMFMAVTLSVSIFMARARKKRRRNESYMSFFFRDLTRKRKKKRRKVNGRGLDESMLPEVSSRRSKTKSIRSSSRRQRSKSAGSKGSRGRSGSALRQVSVQPERSTRSRSRSRASEVKPSPGPRRGGGGVFDLSVQTPQPDDNRQQLV